MRELFKQYMQEVGLRYAITFAKYERINLATVQLWVASTTPTTKPSTVARIYREIIVS